MNLARIIEIYEIIKNRLPKTYPRPKLAFYEDEACMLKNMKIPKLKDGENVYGTVNPNTLTIGLPLYMKFDYIDKHGETIEKSIPITKQDENEIANTLLHECCHLYFGEKYGYESSQFNDEKKCDAFARRWVKVLRKENLL